MGKERVLKLMIRPYKPEDAQATRDLFQETIRTVSRQDYNETQVEAWATGFQTITEWNHRLQNSHSYVVLDSMKIIGFGNVNNQGIVDLLYTHKGYQRQGVATKILTQLEQQANTLGISRLRTEASITARPFFEVHGYQELKKQHVTVRGVTLINYLMEKRIQ